MNILLIIDFYVGCFLDIFRFSRVKIDYGNNFNGRKKQENTNNSRQKKWKIFQHMRNI